MNKKHIIFDWGDTLMRDFPEQPGPMAEWERIEVFSHVPETLKILKQKYILAVATNAGVSDTQLMRKALQRGQIEHFITYFFSSKGLGYTKPDIRFFHEICRQMNANPSSCFYVGNDFHKDIKGASEAGISSVFFNHTGRKEHLPSSAREITSFDELLQIF
jgi:putative hydrolase of the HAD superfamily